MRNRQRLLSIFRGRGSVGGLLLGELESQQLVGDQLVQGGGHSGCEDQALHLSGFLVLRVQDWLRQLLQLLYAAQVWQTKLV